MVHIVEYIALEMIFVSTVTCCRTQKQMDSIPQERIGGTDIHQARRNTGIVIQMLHRVHTESRKRLCVCIPMVKTVDLLVHGGKMEESVSKIKVKTTPYRDGGEGYQKPYNSKGCSK
jgi:hypothetical protein